MIKNSLFILLSVFIFSCNNQQERQAQTETTDETATSTASEKPTLTKVWETEAVMTTAESTLYDKNSNAIFVSNINGHHSEKDGKGFISKMNTDGTVSEQNWITGLNAPKGLAVMNGKLYVTDIDELVEINMSDRKISKKYPVPGATFLNDAATDGKKVYFSDSQTGKVHVLDNGKVSTLTEGMDGINGLAFNDKGQLFVLDGKGLRKYNMDSKDTETINDVVTGGDGLVIIDDDTYIASRWQGEIYLIKDGKEHLLLDTKAEESNTADIDYIEEENLVLVPTFMKNKVVAYRLEY
ncbi:gluconolaconase [soil metagenome]